MYLFWTFVGKAKGSIITVSDLDTCKSNPKFSFENSLAAQVIQQQQSIIKLLSDLVDIHKHQFPQQQ